MWWPRLASTSSGVTTPSDPWEACIPSLPQVNSTAWACHTLRPFYIGGFKETRMSGTNVLVNACWLKYLLAEAEAGITSDSTCWRAQFVSPKTKRAGKGQFFWPNGAPLFKAFRHNTDMSLHRGCPEAWDANKKHFDMWHVSLSWHSQDNKTTSRAGKSKHDTG